MPRNPAAAVAQTPQRTVKKKPINAKSQARKPLAPVSIRKELDAGPHAQASGLAEIRQNKDEPQIELTTTEVEPVARISKQKLEMLAFMREPVTVHIHESSDQQADPHFMIAVNGRKQIFSRGREYTVPRYIVEGLARAKPVGFRNEEYFKPDGERSVRWPSTRGLRYPFSAVKDPSGDKGAAWLKIVLKQP